MNQKKNTENEETEEISDGEFKRFLMTEIKVIKSTVIDTKKDMEGIRKDFEGIKEKQTILEKYSEETKESLRELQSRNDELNRKVNDLEQYSRMENLVISGIPREENENVRQTIVKLVKKLNVNLENNEISTCHRLSNQGMAGIVARINNRDKKMEMIRKSREKKLNAKDMGWEEDQNIYVSNQLTGFTMGILKAAKKLRSENKLEFVWEKEGKVYVRKNETSPAIRITDCEQLEEIIEEYDEESMHSGEESESEESSRIPESRRGLASVKTSEGNSHKQQRDQWKKILNSNRTAKEGNRKGKDQTGTVKFTMNTRKGKGAHSTTRTN